jgi:hypothetical protein
MGASTRMTGAAAWAWLVLLVAGPAAAQEEPFRWSGTLAAGRGSR